MMQQKKIFYKSLKMLFMFFALPSLIKEIFPCLLSDSFRWKLVSFDQNIENPCIKSGCTPASQPEISQNRPNKPEASHNKTLSFVEIRRK